MAKGKKSKKSKPSSGSDDDASPDAGPAPAAAAGKQPFAISDPGRALIERLLEQGRKRSEEPETVYYEGKAGLCKRVRVSNHTIKHSRLGGGTSGLILMLCCVVLMGVIGLAVDYGVNRKPYPVWHLWAPFAAAGAIMGSFFLCFCVGVWRHVDTQELRLITDIELRQNMLQNLLPKKKAKLSFWSLDPTTPTDTILVPDAFDLYEKLCADCDKLRGNADLLIEDVPLHKKAYGKKVLAVCGSFGLLPRRDYNLTSRQLSVMETNCYSLKMTQTSMARVYDLYMTENIIQVCGQLFCGQRIGAFTKAKIYIYTFDRGAGHLIIKPQNAREVFDRLREYVDSKNACKWFWTATKTLGIVTGHFQRHSK